MRGRGWDVVAVAESPDLTGKDDHTVYRLAADSDRLLVTADKDFDNDRRFPLLKGPGVLLLLGTPAKQLKALRRAGPFVQHIMNLGPEILPWNKYIASDASLRWRGRLRSGQLSEDVIWQATPPKPRTRVGKRK
jgi:hypothetical protein